jgi:hypothetical protein
LSFEFAVSPLFPFGCRISLYLFVVSETSGLEAKGFGGGQNRSRSLYKECEMKGHKKNGNKSGHSHAQKPRRAGTMSRPRRGTKVGKDWDEPWSDPADPRVMDASSAGRNFVCILLAVAFITLLFALTGYAMVKNDQQSLKDILPIVKIGLLFAALWGGGRAARKILSGWRGND